MGGNAAADFVHGPAGRAVALDVGEGGGGADVVEIAFWLDEREAEAGDVDGDDGGVVLHEMEGGAAGEDHALAAEFAQVVARGGQGGRADEFTQFHGRLLG